MRDTSSAHSARGLLSGTALTALLLCSSSAVAAGLALGNGVATGATSIAISDPAGTAATASSTFSIAIGSAATATNFNTIAEGQGAMAGGLASVAIGVAANGGGGESVALGPIAQATGAASVAVGFSTLAVGDFSVAQGQSAEADGRHSIALGNIALATGDSSIALGDGASASGLSSVAIGAGSVASSPNTVSFGTPGHERTLVNVAPGIAPTDAVNLSQLTGLKSDVFSGIAASAAMSSAPTPSAPGKTTLIVQSGFFENYTGIGIAFAHRLDTNAPIAIEGGFAHAGGENVGRLGMSIEF